MKQVSTYKVILFLFPFLYSCEERNIVKYDVMKIEDNYDGNNILLSGIPDNYFSGRDRNEKMIIFSDTIDFGEVYIEHTGEIWADKAQLYEGSSYIQIDFPKSLRVFSKDWPQPALSSDWPQSPTFSDKSFGGMVSTSIASEIENENFKSPVIIEITHNFRNPRSIKRIEGKTTFVTGFGIGYENDGETIYCSMIFHCIADLKLKGKFLKN